MIFLRKKHIRFFLLILFVWYYSSVTFFEHTHIVDGFKIEHSHLYNPFKGSKFPDHSHSRNEFILISDLSHFLTTFLSFLFISFIVEVLRHIFLSKRKEAFYYQTIFYTNGLRAPPSLH